jgi:hypothetical protein
MSYHNLGYRKWVHSQPHLIRHIAYTFTRLAQDHHHLPELLDKESTLVVDLVRTHVNLAGLGLPSRFIQSNLWNSLEISLQLEETGSD